MSFSFCFHRAFTDIGIRRERKQSSSSAAFQKVVSLSGKPETCISQQVLCAVATAASASHQEGLQCSKSRAVALPCRCLHIQP